MEDNPLLTKGWGYFQLETVFISFRKFINYSSLEVIVPAIRIGKDLDEIPSHIPIENPGIKGSVSLEKDLHLFSRSILLFSRPETNVKGEEGSSVKSCFDVTLMRACSSGITSAFIWYLKQSPIAGSRYQPVFLLSLQGQ